MGFTPINDKQPVSFVTTEEPQTATKRARAGKRTAKSVPKQSTKRTKLSAKAQDHHASLGASRAQNSVDAIAQQYDSAVCKDTSSSLRRQQLSSGNGAIGNVTSHKSCEFGHTTSEHLRDLTPAEIHTDLNKSVAVLDDNSAVFSSNCDADVSLWAQDAVVVDDGILHAALQDIASPCFDFDSQGQKVAEMSIIGGGVGLLDTNSVPSGPQSCEVSLDLASEFDSDFDVDFKRLSRTTANAERSVDASEDLESAVEEFADQLLDTSDLVDGGDCEAQLPLPSSPRIGFSPPVVEDKTGHMPKLHYRSSQSWNVNAAASSAPGDISPDENIVHPRPSMTCDKSSSSDASAVAAVDSSTSDRPTAAKNNTSSSPLCKAGLRPFVRPSFPQPVRQRSPIAGLSASPQLFTCFRLGEAVKAAATARKERTSAIFEIYAQATSLGQAKGVHSFALADAFHPHRPPFLAATWRGWQGVDCWEKDGLPFADATAHMARILGRMVSRPEGAWAVDIMSIWAATWEDLVAVKNVVCA